MKILPLSIFLSLAAVTAQADALESLKVVFETTDCQGATGLASIEVDRIEKIEALDCPPGTTAQNIKRVYVKGSAPGGHYTLYTVTQGEARKIQAQIQQYMALRQKALEKSTHININY